MMYQTIKSIRLKVLILSIISNIQFLQIRNELTTHVKSHRILLHIGSLLSACIKQKSTLFKYELLKFK